MNSVQAHRLGLLAGITVASLVLLLLQRFGPPPPPQGDSGGQRWPAVPAAAVAPLPRSIIGTSDAEMGMICSSEQSYDIALCLRSDSSIPGIPPPLVELSCRWERDLVAAHGGRNNTCLAFDDLRSQPQEFRSRLTAGARSSVFLLYPQDLPAQEVVQRVKRGLPTGVKPINNPKLVVLNASKTVCTADQRGKEAAYQFVVIVKSATQNFRARSRLREFLHNQISRLPFPVGLIFSMGLPREVQEMASSNDEPILLQHLRTEIERFDDILLTNFVDSYDNLTLKTLINLRFAHTLCRGVSPQFVFLDDDYGLRLQELADSLAGFSRSDLLDAAFGAVNPASPVIRTRGHKWVLGQDVFPYAVLPPYVSGFCYIIGAEAVEALSIVAAFTKPLRLEDVYIGIMVAKLNISLHTLSGIFLKWPPAHTTTRAVVAPIEYFAKNSL